MGQGDDADPNRALLVHHSKEVVEGHDQGQNTSAAACCGVPQNGHPPPKFFWCCGMLLLQLPHPDQIRLERSGRARTCRVTVGSKTIGNSDRTVTLCVRTLATLYICNVRRYQNQTKRYKCIYSAIFVFYLCPQNVLLLTSGTFHAGISGIHRAMPSKKQVGTRLERQFGDK